MWYGEMIQLFNLLNPLPNNAVAAISDDDDVAEDDDDDDDDDYHITTVFSKDCLLLDVLLYKSLVIMCTKGKFWIENYSNSNLYDWSPRYYQGLVIIILTCSLKPSPSHL